MSEGAVARRAKLDELFRKRKHYHSGIASSMPSGIMGQEFAVQYLKVRACMHASAWQQALSGRLHRPRSVLGSHP
jgi:hypothetical protein